MEKSKTLKENLQWLLDYYKRELEDAKKDTKNNDCIYGYSKDQFIIDAENIVIELEHALKISK